MGIFGAFIFLIILYGAILAAVLHNWILSVLLIFLLLASRYDTSKRED